MNIRNRLLFVPNFLAIFILCLSLEGNPGLQQVLSNLTPLQKEALLNSGTSQPTESSPSQSQNESVETVDNGKNDEPTETKISEDQKLNNLIFLEQLLLQDLTDFELQQKEAKEGNSLSSSDEIELLESLEQTRKLITQIKRKQREEIARQSLAVDSLQESPVKPFGYDFLRTNPQGQQSDWLIQVPVDYKVGPGDILEILLFGQKNMAYSLQINRDGIIQFPGVGPINILEQQRDFISIKNSINAKIKQNLGDGVQSSISLGSLRSIPVSIVGQVETPGRFMIAPHSTITSALRIAGGVSEKGSLRNISVKRNGNQLVSFDLYEMLLEGDDTNDITLLAGDVLFVPAVGQQVTVLGEVNIPGLFELKKNTSLASLLSMAGGVSPDAFTKQISLQRKNSYGRYDLRTVDSDEKGDMILNGGDLLEVPKAEKRFVDAIEIIGPVERPGYHQWGKDMKLSDMVTNTGFLLDGADMNFAYLIRTDRFRNISIFHFRPSEVIARKSDYSLVPDDRILFLSNLDEVERFKDLRRLIYQIKKQTPNGLKAKIVTISGEVHFPGEYLFSEKMNVHDLVLAAGGIKDSAYEVDAELTRMSMDANYFTKIEHIRIQPSSFLETNASKEFRLTPYDRLNIKPAPLWNLGQFVTIEGEVNFPGVFQISNGETLQQLLKRAGGLSNFAFPQGAIFTRKHLREKEEKELERLKSQLQADIAKSNLDALNPAEAARASAAASAMMSRLENTDALGRLVIDLNSFAKGSSGNDLFLKDGDKLIVPGFPASVSVLGEVNFPTSHMYNPELSQDDYISMSGGMTDNAAQNNIFVVKADGSVHSKSSNRWFKNKNTSKIQVGDTIVIPIDIKQSRMLEQLSYTSQIIYQMAVAAAAVNSF